MAEDCGHIFCDLCISCWYENNDNCPVCKGHLNPVKNKWIETNIINQFKYHCLHQGCTYVCDVGDNCHGITTHDKVCEFKTIKCICNEEIVQGKLEQHKLETCPLQSIKCELCSHMIERKLMADHLVGGFDDPEYCKGYVKCKNGCDSIIKTNDIQHHAYLCFHRLTSCGKCNNLVKFKDYDAHEDNIDCLKYQRDALNDRIKQSNSQVFQLKSENEQLRFKVTGLQNNEIYLLDKIRLMESSSKRSLSKKSSSKKINVKKKSSKKKTGRRSPVYYNY
jgi:hypothetical protein